MNKNKSTENEKPATIRNKELSPAYKIIAALMAAVVIVSLMFLIRYKPSASTPAQITFEQKMAHLETGAPLPGQNAKPVIPWWMMAMILAFVVIQILPLLLAAKKARAKELTRRELRQIEFLAETPLFLGLLGSLLGVCMTHFLTGTLAAPLAYLTTISGIVLYLTGRFTIMVHLPTTGDLT